MSRPTRIILTGLLVTACGGGSAPDSNAQSAAKPAKRDMSKIEACSLLTPEEIESAAGWKPGAPDPDTHGTTKTCTYQGQKPLTQSVVLVLATPAPKLESSAAMAAWRSKQAARYPDIKMVIKPIEGLGVPAISSELEGMGKPSLELTKNGLLLGVTTSSLELAQALAAKAIPRMP